MQINSITILLAAFILDFIIKISSNFENKSQNNNNYQQVPPFFTSNNNNNYNNNYKQKPSMKISENNEEIKITYDNHKNSKINSNNNNNNYKNFYNNQEYFNDEIIKNNDIYLKIQYCQSWSYRNYFNEIKQILESNYQNVFVEGEEYPLNFYRRSLSYCVTFFQIFLLILIFQPDLIKKYFTIIPLDLINWCIENKWKVIIGGYFFGNMIRNNINNTGAFEIFYNNKLIWSKLKIGNVPKLQFIVSMIEKNGGKFIKI